MRPGNPYGPPSPADVALERRIEIAQTTLALAPRQQRRRAIDMLRRLMHSRSAAQVARLAWDKGLR